MTLTLALLLGACQPEVGPAGDPDPTPAALSLPEVLPSPRPAGPAPSAPPDIVLVTVESLRPDHLSTYGYSRDTAPWLRALGERGVVFERAYATASWEAPALASLMTGLYASQHSVDRGQPSGGAVVGQPALAERLNTLAERLTAAGYHAAAVSASLHASRALGFAQGFDPFIDLGFQDEASAVEAAVRALPPAEGPRFTWVHLRDPRGPYQARSPWYEASLAEPLPTTTLDASSPNQDRAERVSGIDASIRAYDSEISAVDDALSRIVPALDPEGGAVVLVIGVTGEELREQGRMGRRASLGEPVVRVPLIVAAPGVAARRLPGPVSAVDVLPTLVELATGAAPSDVSGHSLAGALRGEPPERRAIALELRATDTRFLRGLVVDDWKLVRIEDASQIYATHLTDLGADPGETRELAAERPELSAALSATLTRFLEKAPTTPPGPVVRAEAP